MDAIGFAASLVSLVQLTSDIVSYLKDVKDAHEHRLTIYEELIGLRVLLAPLEKRVRRSHAEDPWLSSVCALGAHNGLLEQLRNDLLQLLHKLRPVEGAKKVQKMIAWKFTKKDVNNTLNRIERIKMCVELALQNDHLYVTSHHLIHYLILN
jgi:hypothetical protein